MRYKSSGDERTHVEMSELLNPEKKREREREKERKRKKERERRMNQIVAPLS